MSAPPIVANIVDRIVAALPDAEWHYDEEADDLDIILPNVANREAEWLDVEDDFFVRVDPETGEPLSIVIIAFQVWLAEKQGQELPPLDGRIDYTAARQAIERTRRRRAGQPGASAGLPH